MKPHNNQHQTTFKFLPEVERQKHIDEFKWTRIRPGQRVETTHTEVWYEKDTSFQGGGYWGEDPPDIRHERKVEKRWHVYLLPVLVSEYGNEFSLPFFYEMINGVDEPVRVR